MTEQGIINLTNECKNLFREGQLEKGVDYLHQFNRLNPQAAAKVIDWANARSYISDELAQNLSSGKFSFGAMDKQLVIAPECAPSEHEFPYNEVPRNDEGFVL